MQWELPCVVGAWLSWTVYIFDDKSNYKYTNLQIFYVFILMSLQLQLKNNKIFQFTIIILIFIGYIKKNLKVNYLIC